MPKYSVSLSLLLAHCVIVLSLISSVASYANDKLLSDNKTNPKNCVGCHQSAVSDWEKSDHAKAMDLATEKTILGNFNNTTVTHFSQTARFYKQNNQFFMELKHEDKTSNYQIEYVFGHYPLQQYLVKADSGKYQVLPFSWDSRPKEEDGQKWFVMYADEDIKHNDRLHWKQPLQNWNGMCADCHSDGLKRNYDVKADTFNTTYDNINVGCQSCHSKMDDHSKDKTNANNHSNARTQPKIINNWLRKVGESTASWQGEKRDNSFMDTCFACHSLRSPLTNGIDPKAPFLDQFSPSFLAPPMYHADGQIKEEVYVYGSFLQSKMYKAGVNCIDCHDKHTMKIKVQGNGLCLQCHSAEQFNTNEHTKHQENTEGSQCVSCHMPNNRYMGVDDRRDHSFKVPRPHLSVQNNTPNVCTTCHENKSINWATEQLKSWHGKPKNLAKTYQHFIDLQNGKRIQLPDHLALINDPSLNELVRATAITGLVNTTQQLSDQVIKPWVNSSEPLIRLAAARIGQLLPVDQRVMSYASLLSDEFRSIRVAAANQLLNIKNLKSDALAKAVKELLTSNEINSWRGEGNLNQSMIHYNKGQLDKTITSLQNAIKVDPYFTASYINLADIYKNMGNTATEKETFTQALTLMPNDGMIHYSYGLYLIRNKEKAQAIQSFKTAVKLEPSNSQYIYLYVLANDNIGKTKQALMQLRMMIKKVDAPQQLAQLGMSLSQKTADQKSYQYFANMMN